MFAAVVDSVSQNFLDLAVLIALNTLAGIAVLLVLISDAGWPSAAATSLCLFGPATATSLLIALDGVVTAFSKLPAKSKAGSTAR